ARNRPTRISRSRPTTGATASNGGPTPTPPTKCCAAPTCARPPGTWYRPTTSAMRGCRCCATSSKPSKTNSDFLQPLPADACHDPYRDPPPVRRRLRRLAAPLEGLPGVLQGPACRRRHRADVAALPGPGRTHARRAGLARRQGHRHGALDFPPLVLDHRRLLLSAGPVRRSRRARQRRRPGADRTRLRRRACPGRGARVLADARNQYRRHAPVRPHRRPLGLPAVPQGAGLSTRHPDCPLCQQDGGKLLWRGSHLRVIEVDDPDYPGFTRVVWNAHIAEMTSLSTHGRELLMRAVWAVEQA